MRLLKVMYYHLLAISCELGFSLDLETFEEISHDTQFICNVKPSGKYTLPYFGEARGVPVVMKYLESQLKTDVMTVSG